MKKGPTTSLIICLAAIVVITAHTQLTLRQLALRIAGVREGEVHEILDLEAYYSRSPHFDRTKIMLTKQTNVSEVAVLPVPIAQIGS